MKNGPLLFSTIGLLTGIFLTLVLIASRNADFPGGMMGLMGFKNRSNYQASSSNLIGMMGDIDRHFIEQMIPHHEDALTMAQLALELSQRPEIITLAENIIQAQTDEIILMKQMYQDWFEQPVPQTNTQMGMHGMMNTGGMHMGMMGDETDAGALRNARDFDNEFIRQMIPHHQMAVMMATMLKTGTKRREMTELADNIISAQTKEIGEMRTWYKAWY